MILSLSIMIHQGQLFLQAESMVGENGGATLDISKG